MPNIVRFGRLMPKNNRAKKGWGRSSPQSVRLTVAAWTRISISPAVGAGFGVSRILTTSGDP
jgi:hypothetical protein